MNRTLLITGATGTVSGALIDALRDSGIRLRALVRDASAPASQALRARGVHPVAGDLGDPRSLPPAFEGVHDLWLLTPNGPRASEHSMNALWAARQAKAMGAPPGPPRVRGSVVRLSAVGAAHDAPTRSGRLHALSDHEAERSGLGWTILRPHWFMQNLPPGRARSPSPRQRRSARGCSARRSATSRSRTRSASGGCSTAVYRSGSPAC